jgi:hypothetical protein
MGQSIIANRLSDGLVVFYVEAGKWTQDVDSAAIFEPGDVAERALDVARADEAGCLVIDPNLIEVERAEGHVRPTAIREAIRAFGPTPEVRTDTVQSVQP